MGVAVAFTSVAVAALLVAEHGERAWLQRTAKLAASSGFLWAAWSGGGFDSGFGRTMFAGLIACAVGDACLLSRAHRWFLAGLVAFALGHVGYAAAFIGADVVWSSAAMLAGALLVPAVVVWRWLGPHVAADMRVPVLAYIAIITAMVACAWTCDPPGGPWWVRIGATAFYLSDLAVARDVFVRRAFVNRLWGLPLYYGAQLMLATATA